MPVKKFLVVFLVVTFVGVLATLRIEPVRADQECVFDQPDAVQAVDIKILSLVGDGHGHLTVELGVFVLLADLNPVTGPTWSVNPAPYETLEGGQFTQKYVFLRNVDYVVGVAFPNGQYFERTFRW